MPLTITTARSNFEREPLVRPFGFKGGYMREIWQTAVLLESADGERGLGLASQNVLWSDSRVFAATSESGGNALMYAVTDHAAKALEGVSFDTPLSLLDGVLDDTLDYARGVTGCDDLRKTFVLNALVAMDNSAWMLYARENGLSSFDEMIPEEYREALSHRHEAVASIPILAYAMPMAEIEQALQEGYFFLKLKLGHPGTQREMLEKDMERLALVHSTFGDRETPHTASGRIPYYLDFNGRYEKKETLLRLLDHAEELGALSRIAVVEEPFPETSAEEVHDVPVTVAADESAHTAEDVADRIALGYGAIALKPVAKTLSMTLRMARVAHEAGVPCFCADLTVNPILVEWNKNVAARLRPLPGFQVGLLETNGHQNYLHWAAMKRYHPVFTAQWTDPSDGVFHLDEDFYRKSGGILEPSDHYLNLFQHP